MESTNRLRDVENKLDGIQEQIYIISGVAGGLILILIIAIVIIAVKITKLRSSLRAANGGSSGRTGRNGTSAPAAPEEDLTKRGFSAYTGKTEVSAPMQTIAVAPPVQQQQQRQMQPQQQPYSPQVISPRRTEGFSYDNNGYNEQQRQRPANPVGSGGHDVLAGYNIHGGHNINHGGVQVLPKNPPPPRGLQQTDGFF